MRRFRDPYDLTDGSTFLDFHEEMLEAICESHRTEGDDEEHVPHDGWDDDDDHDDDEDEDDEDDEDERPRYGGRTHGGR